MKNLRIGNGGQISGQARFKQRTSNLKPGLSDETRRTASTLMEGYKQ